RPQRDALLVLVALDRIRDARMLGLQRLALTRELQPVGVERGARRLLDRAELLPVGVPGKHRQLRLRVAQRHLLAAKRHPFREQLVLELVLRLGELRRHEPALARLAQPEEQLTVVARRRLLGVAQRLQLAGREQVAVAADDLRLLRHLLLPHAHRPPLLGALEQVLLQARLEGGRREDGRRAHGSTLASRRAVETRSSGANGFASTASAAPASASRSSVPVTIATGIPAERRRSSSPVLGERPRCRSRRTTSGTAAASAASASATVAASSTSKPSSSRFTRESSRSAGSSSTISALGIPRRS